MPPSRPRPAWLVPAIVACAFFMENLDSTIIATALPTMARSFGENPADLNIGIIAYVLTLAVFIPISSWVADRFGSRTVFCAAIVVFVAASVLCGMSDTLAGFTAARILQGGAGAMMVPVGRMIVLRTTSKAQMMRAIATITWPALVAPVIGPSVGGFIATYLDWRWIFLINVPIGIAGLLLVWRFVPDLFSADRRPFDATGFVLSAAALASLMSGLGLLARARPDPLPIASLLAAAIVAGTLAIRHMRRVPHPLIGLAPFDVGTFRDTIVGGSFSRFAVSAGLFLMPLMFQVGFGMSAFQAGMLMLAGAVGSLSTKAIAIGVVRRFGFRTVLTANSALIALATLACAMLSAHTPTAAMVLAMLSCGFTRSLQFTCTNTLAFADMPQERMGMASMLSTMLQQIVMGLGVAFSALTLRTSAWLRGAAPDAMTASDFRVALVALAVVAAMAAVRFSRLEGDAGAEVSGRRV